jgi:hypothetical protein
MAGFVAIRNNSAIHAVLLALARQLTLIMIGRLISNQLFFDCSGFGGSSHLSMSLNYL